jgi:hypothetical protein
MKTRLAVQIAQTPAARLRMQHPRTVQQHGGSGRQSGRTGNSDSLHHHTKSGSSKLRLQRLSMATSHRDGIRIPVATPDDFL